MAQQDARGSRRRLGGVVEMEVYLCSHNRPATGPVLQPGLPESASVLFQRLCILPVLDSDIASRWLQVYTGGRWIADAFKRVTNGPKWRG